jgi:chorismate dehydratase
MSNKCIRVGIVNYKNTLPLIFGLQKMADDGKIELTKNYPSAIADDLQNGKIDIGLIPVAMISQIPNAQIIGKHCIASYQSVASVSLFSQVPIDEIKTIVLDYQSRTSVQLVKILMDKYWKKNVNYVDASDNYIDHLQGTTAGVIIGDRAFEQKGKFAYEYDLAEAWFAMTGLPFVFALWVSTIDLSSDFIHAFDTSNAEGLSMLPEIVAQANYKNYDLYKYYTENICFVMDDDRRRSVELFLDYWLKIMILKYYICNQSLI